MNHSQSTSIYCHRLGHVDCQEVKKPIEVKCPSLANPFYFVFKITESNQLLRRLIRLNLFAALMFVGFINAALATTSVNGTWRNTTVDRIQVEVGGTQTFSDQFADITYSFGESSIDDIDFLAIEVTHSSTIQRLRRIDNDVFNGTTRVVVIYMQHGTWRISKDRCASGTCYATARFVPNFDRIRRSVLNTNRTIVDKLEIRVYASQQQRISKTISVEFVDEENLNYSWYSNADKEIFASSSNERLPRFSGRIEVQQSTLSLQYKGIERINSDQPTTIIGTNSNNDHSYTITQQFGNWTIFPLIQCLSQYCQGVIFNPNANAINSDLSKGKKIVTSLSISNLVNGSAVETKTLSITIYGEPGASGTWSPRTESFIRISSAFANFGPDIDVTTKGHTLANPILTGSLSLFYNKNYSMQISSKEFFIGPGTNQTGNISAPVARTFNGRTKNVRQYGDNFLYGKWVVEDETFGTTTTAATSGERRIWFEIDNSSLTNIAFGTTIRYSLILSFLDSNNNVVDNFSIFARIIRPYPTATLSFVDGSSSPLSINEGDSVAVKVTLDQFPRVPIDVTLSQHDIGSGRGFQGSFSTNPVSIGSSGSATTTFTAGIVDSHDTNGTIDLRVASSSNLASTNSKLTLAITNHSHPTISISSEQDQSSIAEGDDITLKLSAFPRPTTDLAVNLLGSEAGVGVGFISESLEQPVIGTSGILEWVIPTNTVTTHEVDGNITVSIGESDYYEISTHLNQIAVTVTNTDNPTISIVNPPTSVVEGQLISFQLQATPAPIETLNIELEITESETNSGYVRNNSFVNSVTMTTSGLVDVSIDTNILLAAIGAGEVSISIVAGKRYQPSTINGQATVTVTKDSTATIPEVSIAFAGSQDQISEGEDLLFTIRATPRPTKPLYVEFEYLETGSITGYLSSDQKLSPVAIGTSGETTVTIETSKKVANESDGEITINLLSLPTYTISASENELEITIQNEVVPTISITSTKDGEVVEEGENYLFTLTADPAPTENLAVNLSMDGGDTGHYRGILASIQVAPIFNTYGTVTIPPSGTRSVSVLVKNVTSSAEHGQIAISISPVADQSYVIHQTANRVATKIRDTVVPKISITSDFNGEHVIEGDEFSFRLTANPAPLSALNVDLSVSDSGTGHLVGLANGNTVSIGTNGYLEITERMNNVAANQTDGQVDISIATSENFNYTKSSSNQSIRINVLDSTPVVSIQSESNNLNIQEGESFDISLTAYPLKHSITVTLAHTNPSVHFWSYSTGASVTINPNSNNLTGKTVVTVNTRVLANMANGEIAVRVGPSSNATYKLSTTQDLVTVAVKDLTIPTVAISSTKNGSSITEGESFTFSLVATPIQSTDLAIEYVIDSSDSGHFSSFTIENPATTTITGATIPLGTSGTRVVTVNTNYVTATKAHGSITISIISRSTSGYVTSPNAGSIEVSIIDAVKPIVTITSNVSSGYITEGGQFEFTLSASPTPLSPIFVNLTVSDGGSLHFKSLSENFPIEIGTDGVKVILVKTYRVARVERGEINITIDPVGSDADYQLAAETSEQSIRTLIKDQVTSVVSIQAETDTTSITEGDNFSLNLVATPAPVTPISIELEINDGGSGHFSQLSTTNPIVIDETGTVAVTVSTRLIANIQQHGSIGILIATKSNRDFKISQTQNLLTIGVVDHVKPVISISVPNRHQVITEGNGYSVQFTARPRPLTPISVAFTGTDQGTGHYSALPNNSLVEIGLNGSTTITGTTTNNSTSKANGQIDISLNSVSADGNYTVTSVVASQRVRIQVAESEPPIIAISSSLAGKSVVEGESFNVTLTADVAPLFPIQFALQANDMNKGHFLSFTPSSPVTMKNTKSITVAVATQVVAGIAHGSITVSLPTPPAVSYTSSNEESTENNPQSARPAGTDYRVHNENFSVQVGIRDSVKPVVSISTTASVITEGQSFEFTLTATPAPYSPLMVALTAGDAGTGHFVNLSESSPVEISGSTKNVTVTTQLLSAVAHGEINVAIDVASTVYYQSATADADRTLSVTIKDSQAPVVSITSNKHNLSVIEGETFTFRLEAVPTPINDIAVELSITQGTTGHFNRLSSSSPVTITSSGSTDITVYTNSTTTRELGQLGIAVVSRDANVYGKSATAGAINVGIKDAVKSVVSISSTKHNGVVDEGNSFSFRLSATPVPLEEILVDITAADTGTGHLGSLSDPDPVTIGTSGTADVTVATIADSTNVRHGAINISLDEVTSQDYELTTNTADKKIQVKIRDLVKPTISISSTNNGQIITEGGNFEFSLVSSMIPVVPIAVDLDISDGELGHFKNLTPTKPITINGTTPVSVTLTTNNTTTAIQGSIQVAINEGDRSNYLAAANAKSIAVKIKDTVKPVVSIATTQTDNIVTEGNPFNFTITSTPAPIAPILVDITATDGGTNHLGIVTNQVEVGTNGSKSVTVTTLVDSNLVRHGLINIALNAVTNADYEVTTTSSAQEINVKVRDQVVPVVSITSTKNNLSIIEGESFTFKLTSVPTPVSDISIALTLTQGTSGHFDRMSTSNPVTISETGVANVTVYTNVTTKRELGQLGIAVVSNNATIYKKSSTAGSINVGIKDAIKSVISISSTKHNGVINEGDSFDFRLSATPVPLEAILVDITATDSGTGHLGVLSDSSPVEIGTNGIADVSVTTVADAVNIQHGLIDISLAEVINQDYELTAETASQSIQIKIKDNVNPVISITSTQNGQIITEGDSFEFSLEASFSPVVPISVDLTIDDGEIGHFNSLTPADPITISDANPVQVTVSTNNTTTAKQGQIQVSINDVDQFNYTASTSANLIQVKIKDTVKPVVTISSLQNNGVVTEGESFAVTLSSTPAPITPIMVGITGTNNATSHLGVLANQVEIDTTGTKSITVPTLIEANEKRHGAIKISLDAVNNSAYEISTTLSEREINVTIRDRVTPVVSITSDDHNRSIIEGESFAIRLEANPTPIESIAVELELTTGTTGHFNRLSQSNPVTITDSGVAEITVLTNSTTIRELGQIGIAVLSNDLTIYEKSSTAGAISVGIKDAIKSVVSISSTKHSGIITEGESFDFRLTASPVPLEPISVGLTATDSGTGHLGTWSEPSPVEIGTSGTVDVSVATIADAANIQHGVIDILLTEVTSQDFELTSITTDKAIQVKIKDQVNPTVSITSTHNNQIITEGNSFEFSLEASFTPIEPISIDLDINDGGSGHFKHLTPAEPITISGPDPVVVTLATNNTTIAGQGQIQVIINDGDGSSYTASNLASTIQIKIKDSITPVVSMTSTQNLEIVTEGSSFEITLSANPAPISPILVDVVGADQGTNHLGTFVNQVEIGTNGTKSITIPTLIETNHIRHGDIKISLAEVSNSAYEVTSDVANQMVQVKIRDQVAPVVSITSTHNNTPITEGGSLEFSLIATPEPLTPISVELEIDDTSQHFSRLSQSSPITISNGDPVVLTLYTKSTSPHEKGRIRIAVVQSELSTNSQPNSINNLASAIVVEIADALIPVVAMTSPENGSIITEGDNFSITLAAEPAPHTPIMVALVVTDSAEHLAAKSALSAVEIGLSGTTTISVPTIVDAETIQHGDIKISLDREGNPNYQVTSNGATRSIQVAIKDEVEPVVSINSDYNGDSIVEGASFTFNLSVSPAPIVPITVSLDVDDKNLGHFNQFSVATPIQLSNTKPQEVVVLTNVFYSGQNQGKITVRIANDQQQDFLTSSTNDVVSVAIRDAEKPTVALVLSNPETPVMEGEKIQFQLQAIPAPLIPIQVAVTSSDGGTDHFARISENGQYTIGLDGIIQGIVTTNNNTSWRGHGKIFLHVEPSSTYNLADELSEAEIVVLDSESSEVPEIFVTAPAVVPAGQSSIDFTFIAIPTPQEEIEVAFQVFQSSEIIQWRVPKLIKIRDTKTVSIQIQDNLNHESANYLSLLLMEQPHYITNLSLINVEIVNTNENVHNVEEESQSRISVASVVANQLTENVYEHIVSPVQGESSIEVRPVVSIVALSESVQEGEPVQFLLSSSSIMDDSINLELTETGNFLVENSIAAFSLGGRPEAVLEISTIDNVFASSDGIVTLTIIEGENYAILPNSHSDSVTILKSAEQESQDEELIAMIETVLPELSQSEQEMINDTITDRLQLSSSAGRESYFNLGGQQSLTNLIQTTGELVQDNANLARDLFNGTNFEFNVMPTIGLYSPLSIWGQSTFNGLDSIGISNEIYGSGELASNQFGIDTQLTPEWITGIGGQFSQSAISYSTVHHSAGQLFVSSNQINPYLGWSSNHNDSYFHSILGIGIGELAINQSGSQRRKYDTSIVSLALEGILELLSWSAKFDESNTALKITSNTYLSNQVVNNDASPEKVSEFNARLAQFALEGEHNFELGRNSLLKPKVSIGLKTEDVTNHESTRFDFTGGIEFSMQSGLELIGEGTLHTSKFGVIESSQFNSKLGYDLNKDGVGWVLDLSSITCSGCKSNFANDLKPATELWKPSAELTNHNSGLDFNKFSGEIGYGFVLGDWVGEWSPFASVDISTGGLMQQQFGGRFSANSILELELVGSKNQNHRVKDEYQLKINGNLNW